MSLAVTFTEPNTVNTTEDILFTGAVWDSGHSNWVLLGMRSPANVNQVQTSPDKTTWTIHAMPSTSAYRAIAYAATLGAAGRLVAVGTTAGVGVAAWSDDGGATWAAATSLPETNNWEDVKWWPALGIFVACASTGVHRNMTSADGKSWTMQTAASALAWSGLNISGAVAVCVAFLSGSTSTQLIQTSPDGVNWTLQTHSAIETRRGLVAAGSRLSVGYSDDLDMFLITGTDGGGTTKAYRSTDDGATWTASGVIPTIGDNTNRGYIWISGAGGWYMSCANFNWCESDDGDAWTRHAHTLASGHSGFTPMHWDESQATILGGSTLGFDRVLVGAITLTPTVTGVVPSSGTTLGGTALTITGTNFTGSPTVTLGGLAATLVTVVNPTTITANAPAHAAGAVDLAVTGAAALAAAYAYVAPPSLDSVSPRKGPTTGGLNVTLRGLGFTGLTADLITFDGAVVTNLNVVSDTELRCMPAAHAVGLVDIVVAGCGTLPAGYRYQRNTARLTIQDTDAANLPPIPEPTTPVDPRTGKIHQDYLLWLNTLKLRVEAVKEIDASTIVSGEFDEILLPTIPWSKIDPTGSSLADLTTRDAGDLSSGTLLAVRLPAFTGDLSTPIGSAETTLATVNPDTVGTFGSANQTLTVTVNEKGLVTGIKAQTIAPIVPKALTRVNDTNVTATLTGLPFDALVNPVTITLGWLGTLAPVRGGTGTGTLFTAGSVVFAGPSGVYAQDNAKLFWDDSNNWLGIGTAAPSTPLTVLHTTSAVVLTSQVSTNAVGPQFSLAKSRGAVGALTTVATADELGALAFKGYDGSNYISSAAIIVSATGTVAATRVPSDMDFYTSTNAAPSVLTKRMTIANTGNVGIASLGTANLLNVGGTQAGNASFEVSCGSGVVFQSFNRLLSVYTSMSVDGLAVNIRPSGTTAIGVQAGGLIAFGTHSATAVLHIKAGTATASTAPLKLTSGTVLTTAEAGAIEFTTDDFFATITTGAARKAFVLDDGARLTSGKIPVATTNGRLVNLTASSAYTPTNVTTDRAYDANATTIDELADVIGTIVADLQAKGILG